jgi:predicted RNA-binding protein YlxR (DUF448 family)
LRTKPNDNLGLAEREQHVPERTCVLTRRKGTKDELIRLALGPDGQVAPDVRARAPGRGAWIGLSRDELDQAIANGKLKSALQRAFKSTAVIVSPDLGARTAAALRQAVLDRMGMEARSGNLINGADRVETAARAGKVAMLVHAADAGEDGRKKLDQAWRVGGVDQQVDFAGAGRGFDAVVAVDEVARARFHPQPVERGLAQRMLGAFSEVRRDLDRVGLEGPLERGLELAFGTGLVELGAGHSDPCAAARSPRAHVRRDDAIRA